MMAHSKRMHPTAPPLCSGAAADAQRQANKKRRPGSPVRPRSGGGGARETIAPLLEEKIASGHNEGVYHWILILPTMGSGLAMTLSNGDPEPAVGSGLYF